MLFAHFIFNSLIEQVIIDFTGTVIDSINCFHNFIIHCFEIDFSIKNEKFKI